VFLRSFIGAVISVCLLLVGFSCSSSDSENEDQAIAETGTNSNETEQEVESTPEPEPEPSTEETSEPVENEPENNEEFDYTTGDSSYIFDQNQLHTFELTLSEEDLALIDKEPGKEEYVEGSMIFEGQKIGPVGIRYKGSVGAWVGCVSGDFFQAEGEKTCTKLSMKVKINWEDTDDTFYGLKKLQFHSQNLDPTKMHERLGYWLFREMGVPAPRSVHARLFINGEYNGIFALTEQIDGRFTRENFEDGTGNLYKEIWPIRSNGEPRSDGEYVYALKTNEHNDPSFEIIRSFGDAMGSATADERMQIVQEWMDVDEVLAYAVVDRTIRNDDGVFHWYCFGGGSGLLGAGGEGDIPNEACNPHNFYWYEEPTEKTMHLIPWDLDNAFEVIKNEGNPVIPIKDSWGEKTNGCKPFVYGGWGLAQLSAACDKIIGTWASFESEHQRIMDAFLEGPFSKETVEDLIDTWAAQIESSVAQADVVHDDQPSVEEWRRALERFKDDLEYARAKND
jgi:spore coat protein CotH